MSGYCSKCGNQQCTCNEIVNDNTQEKIKIVCKELENFLLEKNKRYKDSAINPRRSFSKLDSKEQIKIRLDDKLNRIENSDIDRKNDYVDLLGYLVLMCVTNNWLDFQDIID